MIALPAPDGWLLDYFVRLHSAAFEANGACALGNTRWEKGPMSISELGPMP